MPGPKRRAQPSTEPELKSQVTWESPPEKTTAYDWSKIAKSLRRRPGKWAKIFDLDRVSIANSVRQGSVKVLHPDLGFEFRTSNNTSGSGPERKCTLYIRYNPDKVD